MIIDVFTYNGESDLLDLRLNILDSVVGQFIICEAMTTFSGKPKPLYYSAQKNWFKKWHDKIKYYVIDENYTPEEIKQAEESPNTRGAEHWKHEFLQKESIKKALTHLDDEDVVFIGDVDEIWDPEGGFRMGEKVKLKVYTYYLNNRSSEQFWGTFVDNYRYIKNECLNHLRSNRDILAENDCGWHFTSMAEDLERKLLDSYTSDSYAMPQVMAQLQNNISNKRDFLGRDFTYKIDERDWPEYLKANKEKYGHLCDNS